MAVLVNDNEIVLTGTVGESYWGDGFTAVEVITALAKVGRDTDIVVRLNSGGGIATEGAAIHAALSAHKGNVDLVVEGIAASAASVIAMAGDKISMTLGSVMMIHDASTFAWGDAAELTKAVSALDTLSNAYASIYADRTGKSAAEMRDLMKAETWLTADEAVATGFADDAASADNDNEPAEASAFAYASYQHAPERFVALADARGWKFPTPMAAKPAATTRQPKETPMTVTNPAGQTPAAAIDSAKIAADTQARIKAILSHEEAAGRETLAQHLAFNTANSVEDAVATLMASPKASPAPAETEQPDPVAYDRLRTDASAQAQPQPGSGKQSIAQRALANHRLVTGTPAKA